VEALGRCVEKAKLVDERLHCFSVRAFFHWPTIRSLGERCHMINNHSIWEIMTFFQCEWRLFDHCFQRFG
jgi:hypothetical protein